MGKMKCFPPFICDVTSAAKNHAVPGRPQQAWASLGKAAGTEENSLERAQPQALPSRKMESSCGILPPWGMFQFVSHIC